MDVQLRLGPGDAVLVGAPPAAPAGSGVVALHGAEVYVDPTAPDDPPHAVVHDAAAAEAGLEHLYGTAVAEAAARVAASDGDAEIVAVDPTPAATAVRTLGLVRWLESHSPDLLPGGLLDVEFGTAAAALEDLLSEHEESEGERRLVHSAELVAALSRRLRDGGPPPAPAGLAALLGAAVPHLHGVLPFDSPHVDDLQHEEELARALRALGADGVTLDWSELAGRPGVGDRDVLGAGHAARGALGTARRDSVDWYQVPRGLLDTAERTVRWWLSDDDEPTVTVAVPAVVGARAGGRLAFRLYAEGMPLPIAVGSLRRSTDGREFAGAAPLLGAPLGRLTLDVHDPADPRPPRLGSDRHTTEAVRWTARAVTALRLGGPAADQTAQAALQEAARLFQRVRTRHPRPEQKQLAQRRQARCFAVLRSVLLRRGNEPEAARLEHRWGTSTAVAGEADVRPPDLDGPGWIALAAENALTADPGWQLR